MGVPLWELPGLSLSVVRPIWVSAFVLVSEQSWVYKWGWCAAHLGVLEGHDRLKPIGPIVGWYVQKEFRTNVQAGVGSNKVTPQCT
jgi:hypothetical protein